MIALNAQQTLHALPWLELINAIERGFQNDCVTPLRHQHEIVNTVEANAHLLLMPAWITGQYLGIKQAMVVPDNQQRGLPSVSASYQLFNALTGQLLALFDGTVLTNRRTAAASALAARILSREDSAHLLIVGTGALARCLVAAHSTIRPITQISIWGRSPDKAQQMADEMNELGFNAQATNDLATASNTADIISCATLADKPLVLGQWLSPGTHVDLVGSFTPTMRESDDALMQRGSLFIDTYQGALNEAGDIIQAINSGAITQDHIVSDLFELCSTKPKRVGAEQITVFKSVGTALEDLAAAILAYDSIR